MLSLLRRRMRCRLLPQTKAKKKETRVQGRDGRTARRHHTGISRGEVWCFRDQGSCCLPRKFSCTPATTLVRITTALNSGSCSTAAPAQHVCIALARFLPSPCTCAFARACRPLHPTWDPKRCTAHVAAHRDCRARHESGAAATPCPLRSRDARSKHALLIPSHDADARPPSPPSAASLDI